jgi:hypothetical protein
MQRSHETEIALAGVDRFLGAKHRG